MAEPRAKREFSEAKLEKQQDAFKAMRESDRPDDGWGPLDALAGETETMLIEWAARRQPAEDRWIADAEQYAGLNDPATEARLRKQPGVSRIVINFTREKTKVLESRLNDSLLPTDTPTWSLKPTPVPDLQPEVIDDVFRDAELQWLDYKAQQAQQASASEQQPEQPQQDPSMAAEQLPGDQAGAPVPPLSTCLLYTSPSPRD